MRGWTGGERRDPQFVGFGQSGLQGAQDGVTQCGALVPGSRGTEHDGCAGAPNVFHGPRDDEEGGECLRRPRRRVAGEVQESERAASVLPEVLPASRGRGVVRAGGRVERGEGEGRAESLGLGPRAWVGDAGGHHRGQALVVIENEVAGRSLGAGRRKWGRRHRRGPPLLGDHPLTPTTSACSYGSPVYERTLRQPTSVSHRS